MTIRYYLGALLVLGLVLPGCGPDAPPTPGVPPTLAATATATTPAFTPTQEDPMRSLSILDLPPPAPGTHVAYGTDRSQFGELRLPPGPGPHPVVVVVHGGFWRAAFDLAHIGHFCVALNRAGVATWSLEYRRLGNPGGGWPGTFTDVAVGLDALRMLAPTYDLDLDRVVVTGHSAGGQLALWLAGRRRIPVGDPLYSADPLPVRGVVALAPVADLARGWELGTGGGVIATLLGGTPAQVPARYAVASPRALLPLGVPQRLVHGTADPNVPFTLSESYQAAATAAGADARLVALPDAGHFEVIDPRSQEWPQVQAAILELLGK
jgi:acetyl esterase/lipase